MELNKNKNKNKLTNNLTAKKPNKPEEADNEEENVKVIEWENYEEELVKLLSLSSALNEANRKKQHLTAKLDSLIQVKAESLSRLNELEEMHQKLEARESSTASMLTRSKVAMEDSKNQEEWLSSEVRSLLVAGTTLSVARKQVECAKNLKMHHQLSQEANRSLGGEKGYAHLRKLQRRLRIRQQYMISQVSLLYPVKTSIGHSREQELDSLPSSSRSGISAETKPVKHGSLMILGLQLTMLPFTKMSFFTNKKEVQRSAAALGYVAHAVSLIASYLEVPLRYPIRLGGSHSYIKDHASSVESTSSDVSLTTSLSTNMPVEFPLFLDGQDTTRAAYAVFLLNKDLEQLLNFIGVRSLGPRHVLANLKELMRIILSADYIDCI